MIATPRARRLALLTLSAALVAPALPAAALPAASPAADARTASLRAWVQEMKQQPRGPFSRVMWYCADGAVLDPRPGACVARGGGVQHGEWSERTRAIRAAGYPIANVLAAMPPADVAAIGADHGRLAPLLVERFLIGADDGWILRRAQYYRGALQDYNEREGGRLLLHAVLRDEAALADSFPILREAARLLPHRDEIPLFTQVRGLATTLGEKDPQFHPLRVRIHNAPDVADAGRVRAYAASPQAKPELRDSYATLAATIERAYRPSDLPAALKSLAGQIKAPQAAVQLRKLGEDLAASTDAQTRFGLAADVVLLLREQVAQLGTPGQRLAALDASLDAESVAFQASRELQKLLPAATRAQRLAWIAISARTVSGLGLLNARELAEIERSIHALGDARVPLADYRAALQELERAANWPARRLDYHFGEAIERMERIEPLARGYIPDRLRGSPLLFYSSVLETLVQDAGQIGNTRHSLFGKATGSGLRRLNPGIGRGILRVSTKGPIDAAARPAIWLVAETSSDLPPAAGIITAEEGNAVSHVQLLARNLGIPNVVAGQGLLAGLTARSGQSIVIAASVGGVVHIEADGPQWEATLGNLQAGAPRAIEVNLAKLDLEQAQPLSTAQLRAVQSGRVVGPKAAQVGELAHHFPDKVSPGLALPFGIYRQLLQRPVRAGGPPMMEWLTAQYNELALRKSLDPEYYARRLPEVLAFARDWFARVELGEELRARLFGAMHDRFGMDGSYGVFVRSDTNVEDLPGFTGAGLNLTVPNVAGFDEVVAALRRVWASPFTERAFGWRQDLMDHPEHVYASVLLHRSVYNDKSGVFITADLDTGDRDAITVATNLGVAGAVDGQAAESLRVSLKTGEARLLSSATARQRLELLPQGGSRMQPAAAPDFVLTPAEIAQLVEFVRTMPSDYPGLLDAEGKPAAADIEFGFVGGRLMLLQIRPFLRNLAAARNAYLIKMDAPLRDADRTSVDLRDAPEARSS